MSVEFNDNSDDDEKKGSSSSSATGVKVGRELLTGATKDSGDKAGEIAKTNFLDKWLHDKNGAPEQTKEKPLFHLPKAKPESEEAKSESNVESELEKPLVAQPEAAVDTDTEASEDLGDPSVESLSIGEEAVAEKVAAQDVSAELVAERESTQDPAEIAGIDAALENLERKVAQAENTPLEMVNAEPEAAESDAVEQVEGAQAEADDGPAEFEDDFELNLNTPEQTAEAMDEDEPDPQQTTSQSQQGQQPPNSPNNSGNNTNGNQPPNPPNNPNNPPANPANQGPNGPGGTINFNTANFYGYNPDAPQASYVENNYFFQENSGAALLAGGILGYMLGRRRGRIKTEKRMKAVSKKLEKQISGIREDVRQQSAVIRQQARDRYNAEHSRGAETTAARAMDVGRRSETLTELTGSQTATNRRQAAERLSVSQAEAALTAERVQRMDHREVMAIAEKIHIDGTSLRTIYEAKQITEPGLRRLTREFLRGGDIKAALAHEIEVKEMQYERDPQMRDRLAASYAGVEEAQPQTSTAGIEILQAQNQQPKPYQMHHSVKQAADEALARKQRGKQVLVATWAVTIFVLVIVALVLAAR